MKRTSCFIYLWKRAVLLASSVIVSNILTAQGPPKKSSMSDPAVLIIVIIMLVLLLIIGLLANVVAGAAGYYRNKQKEEAQQKESGSATATTTIVAALLFFASPLYAQDANTTNITQPSSNIGGLSDMAFYLMTSVIVIEVLVIFVLLYQLRIFLRKEKIKIIADTVARPNRWALLWTRLNSFRSPEQEADMDLGHDYDGIRELDNRLPPWWLYGFYLTIVFAGIYLWRFHVSHTAPLSGEEYQIAVKQADEQRAIYLSKAANNVDETTVKLLADELSITSGKNIFVQTCAACHGKSGEGIVGPNLTDDYWLHGGSVGDVFKTIKYGWPEKGMKSWKDDFSPVQIAQLTSYIKSLHGSNPPNAKDKQGELYQDNVETVPKNNSDSGTVKNKITAIK